MSELLLLGISHKTAPVRLRERLALAEPAVPGFLHAVAAEPGVEEAVVLSTCNRTELVLVVDDPVAAEAAVLGRLARGAGIRPTQLAGIVYAARNCDAARQLFRVTAGLESMIVGEAEVQGQVRRAYETALAAGTTGPLTNRLYTAALQAGKRARSETRLGAGHASLSSVAVALAEEILGDLRRRDVLVVGAGESSELTARALHERGVRTLFVANRRVDRARALAERFGGAVIAFDELPARLEQADIVVSSTASSQPIVGQEELDVVMRARGRRPLMLVDLAVPRDVDPACGTLEGVALYDIDDLQAVVDRTLDGRGAEALRAETIVEDEIGRFADWLGTLASRPTVAALRAHGTGIVEQVLAENAGRWESASPRDLARMDAIARAVMNRLLHEPTIRLRAVGQEGHHGRLEVVRELFGLHGHEPEAPEQDQGAEVRPLAPRHTGS